MPKPTVMIDYRKCRVDRCEQGRCAAVGKCPRNILRQEADFEMPDVYPGVCRGCALCVPACSFAAIQIR